MFYIDLSNFTDKITFNYLKENGEDGLNNLKRVVSKMKKNVSHKTEVVDKEKETDQMEELLNKLEEDGN